MKHSSLCLNLCCFVVFASTSCSSPNEWVLTSPNEAVRFSLTNDDGHLSYSVHSQDSVVITSSRLGVMVDSVDYGTDAVFIAAAPMRGVYTSSEGQAGREPADADHCHEQQFDFRTPEGKGFSIVARAYNDGVAFRYLLKERGSDTPHTIPWRIVALGADSSAVLRSGILQHLGVQPAVMD